MTNTTIVELAIGARDLVADAVRTVVGSVSKANEIDWAILNEQWVRVTVRGAKAKARLNKIHKELRDKHDKAVLCDPHETFSNVTVYRVKVR